MTEAVYLCIGDEILSGKIRDANGYQVATALFAHGVALTRIEVLPDVPEVIAERIQYYHPRTDAIITSGGIGPTHDDVTYASVGLAFGRPLVENAALVAVMQTHYDARGIKLNAARRRMATFPEGAEVMRDDDNWVPLVRVENVYVLPGVPKLFNMLLPRVIGCLPRGEAYRRLVYTQLGEGDLAEALGKIAAAHPEVAIGSYPHYDVPDHKVMLTVDGTDAGIVENIAKMLVDAFAGFEKDDAIASPERAQDKRHLD